MKCKFKRGDIVRIVEARGTIALPHRYVVVAVPPQNDLVRGRVDIIALEVATKPLGKVGVGMPTKYLAKTGVFKV